MASSLGQQVSRRKLRLFLCASARRVWHLLTDPAYREAVERAEAYADDRITAEDLAGARQRAWDLHYQPFRLTPGREPGPHLTQEELDLFARRHVAVRAALDDGGLRLGRYTQEQMVWRAFPDEARADCNLLREVFGNPFRPLAPIASAVLVYNGRAARRLAESIYTARRFEDLPVLADLLEEAGLTDAGLLGHLRGPGPHALGCHALDAVLGKS
jgi:hypothetical protein